MFSQGKRLSRNSLHKGLLQESTQRSELHLAVPALLNDNHVRLGKSFAHSWLRIPSSTFTIQEHMGSLVSLHSCPSVQMAWSLPTSQSDGCSRVHVACNYGFRRAARTIVKTPFLLQDVSHLYQQSSFGTTCPLTLEQRCLNVFDRNKKEAVS